MKSLTLVALLCILAVGCKDKRSATDEALNRLALTSAIKGFSAGTNGESYESFTNRFWTHISPP